MKVLLVTLSLLYTITSIGQIVGNPTNDESRDQLMHDLILAEFDGVWSAMDSTNIEKFHTADFILLEHGEEWDNQVIRNYIKSSLVNGPSSERKNKIEIILTKKAGEKIWAAYHNYAVFSQDGVETGKMHWLESVVAVPTKDGWKLEMMHSTRVQN